MKDRNENFEDWLKAFGLAVDDWQKQLILEGLRLNREQTHGTSYYRQAGQKSGKSHQVACEMAEKIVKALNSHMGVDVQIGSATREDVLMLAHELEIRGFRLNIPAMLKALAWAE